MKIEIHYFHPPPGNYIQVWKIVPADDNNKNNNNKMISLLVSRRRRWRRWRRRREGVKMAVGVLLN